MALNALKALRDTALSISTSSSAVEQSFNGSAVFLACFATKNAVIGELLAYAGVALTVRVLAHWHGNPIHSLLLTLVAHQGASHTEPPGPA